MDDLSVNLKECLTGCIAGGIIVNNVMYADDIVGLLLSPSATGLSFRLHVCGKYGLQHDIRFNSKKSAVIIFRNSFVKDFSYPSFVMNGEVPFVKHLGHVISADMKDDLDIMRQCRQLYAQGNALARRFHMCSDNVKETIFRSYCSSLYTSQLWWKYKVNSIRKLYVAYKNAFRMLFMLPRDCSASGMFAVHNVMSCPALVRKLVFGFLQGSESLSKFYCAGYVHLPSGGSLQLESTGINCYMCITLARVQAKPHKLSFICCFCIFLLCCCHLLTYPPLHCVVCRLGS